MDKIKIFIADDYPVVRRGIKTIFSESPDYHVVGEAEDGLRVLEDVRRLRPDVVFMDIIMPHLDGIQATKLITKEFPETRVVILSMHHDPVYALDAFRAGAWAYVLKGDDPSELFRAVEKVTAGRRYASPSIADELLSDFVEIIAKEPGTEPYDSLTSREREILRLIAEGYRSREIADKLFISLSTVKSHRIHLMKKLRVNDIAGLVKVAIRKGVINVNVK